MSTAQKLRPNEIERLTVLAKIKEVAHRSMSAQLTAREINRDSDIMRFIEAIRFDDPDVSSPGFSIFLTFVDHPTEVINVESLDVPPPGHQWAGGVPKRRHY